MANTPGVWTTKLTDTFTLKLGMAEAAAACTQAAHDTKGWQVKLAEPNRVVVKSLPGFISVRTYSIEIALAEAQSGETALTLTGWTVAKGLGMKSMVRDAMGKFRAAIEAHA